MMISRVLAISFIAVACSGCSIFAIGEEEYACKGYPERKNCLSAREIYQLTNYKDSLDEVALTEQQTEYAYDDDDDDEEWDEEPEASDAVVERPVEPVRQAPSASAAQPAATVPRIEGGSLPIRTTAKVMRIWVAPWEDKGGIFHAPGLVYKEIEQRRWALGLPRYDNVRYLSPR